MHPQLGLFVLVSAGAAGATGLLARTHPSLFSPYFGEFHPLLAVVLLAVAGAAAVHRLASEDGFPVFAGIRGIRGFSRAATLAPLFALSAIGADLVFRFPESLNVRWPHSILYYPAMAYVAEVVFHVLPAALPTAALKLIFKKGGRLLVLIPLLLAALLEPTLEWSLAGEPGSWEGAWLWLHLFTFNLVQIRLFWRYDLLSMLSLRLIYYAYWHIGWGAARLYLLF